MMGLTIELTLVDYVVNSLLIFVDKEYGTSHEQIYWLIVKFTKRVKGL